MTTDLTPSPAGERKPHTLHGHGLFYVTRDGTQLFELARDDRVIELLFRPEADVLAALLSYALEHQFGTLVPLAHVLHQAAEDIEASK